MSDITYEHIKAIAKLENDVKERDATIKQLKGDIDHNVKRALEIAEERDRLKEALGNLYKEIRSRFAKDNDIAFESMSIDLAKPMLEARKLIEP